MPASRHFRLFALPLLLAGTGALANEAPPPTFSFHPGSPMSDLPPGFDQLSTADQLKFLQSRLAVLGVLQQVTEAQKTISGATKESSTPPVPVRGPAAAAQPAPVLVQNPTPATPTPPSVQRIYVRDGVRMADLLLPGRGGIRTVRTGSQIGSGMQVAEITAEDVVVTMAAERMSLPGSAGPSQQAQSQTSIGEPPAAIERSEGPPLQHVPPGAIVGRPAAKPTELQPDGR